MIAAYESHSNQWNGRPLNSGDSDPAETDIYARPSKDASRGSALNVLVNSTVLGYATRSLRSALVMRAIDSLDPFHRDESILEFRDPCLIVSAAALGDLIIQMPVIEGLIRKCDQEKLRVQVALRPAHAAIGRKCGWPVLEIENPLQDMFGGTASLEMILRVIKDIVRLRRRGFKTCIDLSGNAFNAVALRLGGVRRLASKCTRGGKSLIHHVLPGVPFENEYAYHERLANYLGCGFESGVFLKLTSGTRLSHVVLGLTTNCRWRNWPMYRFLELVQSQPDRIFFATGNPNEIAEEDKESFRRLCNLSNVLNRVGKLSLLEFIETVSSAAAVVTNDTGTAHVANAFRIPGAVLFGPGISEQWAAPHGLRVFQDRTCNHYPCAAWNYKQPDRWCMRGISVQEVATHLQSVLGNR